MPVTKEKKTRLGGDLFPKLLREEPPFDVSKEDVWMGAKDAGVCLQSYLRYRVRYRGNTGKVQSITLCTEYRVGNHRPSPRLNAPTVL